MTFFNELKRRNVIKVTFAYIVVAWLVAQVLQLIFESFGAPDWVMKAVLVILAAGSAFAIFFSWAFEMTPEGIKREHEVDRTKSITPQTGKKLNNLILAVLALALAYFAYDKFILSKGRDAALIKATTQAISEEAVTEEPLAQPDKSIAVLPFVNMSDDASNEYFSDGLSEELLNLLAKIPELRVAARTSAFSLKGKELQISEVGEILKVTHVLEGSVRKAGNQIRITAQLILVKDGYHLWSETYDRSLDNIFAIQDEIAAAVVKELKVSLLGAVPTVKKIDPEAYALYLEARHLALRRNPESFEQAIDLYQKALKIVPSYAAAWVGLGRVYEEQAHQALRPYNEGLKLANQAVDKALAIDPDYAPAHGLLGWLAMYFDNDLGAAAKHLKRALVLEPGNLDSLRQASILLKNLGRVEQGIYVLQYILERDPVNLRTLGNIGLAYNALGRPDEALPPLLTELRLSPDNLVTQFNIAFALLQKNEPEAALVAIKQEPFEAYRLIGLVMAYHALGQKSESDAALAELIDKYEQDAAYNIAYDMAYRGEADRAFKWLAKAVEYKDGGLAEIPAQLEFANIYDDPRWLPFLESIGKSPAQLDAIDFKVTLPE